MLFDLLAEAGIKPTVFCDSYAGQKKERNFCGLPVLSPDELKHRMSKEDFCIIISSQYVDEILEVLELKGMLSEYVFTAFSVNISLWYAAQECDILSPVYCEKIKLQKELFCVFGRDMSFEFDNSMTKVRMDRLLSSNKDIILAFQPPKVGSISIFCSIDSLRYITMHFHDLEIFFENINVDNKIEFWKQCLKVINNSGRKIRIITGVREPIIRDISGYFETLGVTNGKILDTGKSFVENVLSYIISRIKREK